MTVNTNRALRLVVNGKAAGDPALRTAVSQVRERGVSLEVRVTWEGGDAARYAAEAVDKGLDVVVAAGGDGTVNEVVNGVLEADDAPKIAVGVVPYGTANDFAVGCGIPKGDPLAALTLITETDPTPIDVGKVNDRHFINVASGGFGAEVTASTPREMKKALGGVAYSLMGLVTAAKMSPYRGRMITPDGEAEGQMILTSIGNGRQAGGGFQVCPQALLDDGLLDVMTVHDVPVLEFGVVLSELMNLDRPENKYVTYRKLSSFEVEAEQEVPMSLDGEPIRARRFLFQLLPKRLPFILPSAAPLLARV
jgi:lipid kinase YegS